MKLSCYETIGAVVPNEGTDFGAKGFVILRYKQSRVVWRLGATAWSGVGMKSYYPALLQVEAVPMVGFGGTTNIEVINGGRLSNKRWLQAREKIAEYLKVPVTEIPSLLPDGTTEIGLAQKKN